MERISLLEIIGPCCSTTADGRKVNLLMWSLLDQGMSVELDFRGVKLVTPSFYRAAVGELYYRFSDETIRSRLHLSELPNS